MCFNQRQWGWSMGNRHSQCAWDWHKRRDPRDQGWRDSNRDNPNNASGYEPKVKVRANGKQYCPSGAGGIQPRTECFLLHQQRQVEYAIFGKLVQIYPKCPLLGRVGSNKIFVESYLLLVCHLYHVSLHNNETHTRLAMPRPAHTRVGICPGHRQHTYIRWIMLLALDSHFPIQNLILLKQFQISHS